MSCLYESFRRDLNETQVNKEELEQKIKEEQEERIKKENIEKYGIRDFNLNLSLLIILGFLAFLEDYLSKEIYGISMTFLFIQIIRIFDKYNNMKLAIKLREEKKEKKENS